MKQRLIILFLILVIIGMSILLWWNQAIKPSDPQNVQNATFTISRGENVRDIAERLQKDNLIRSSVAFFLIARFGGLAQNIQSGDFKLNPAMDLFTVANTLTHGTTDVRITIPEGWRDEEISLELTKELNIPESEFLKVANEGFMFPDTYMLPKNASASTVVRLMQSNFHKKVKGDIISKAQVKGLSLNDLITVASLVEREAKLPKDRPLVASVILNRLKIGMKLDIDATVQYALGYQPANQSWWKKDLTQEDLQIDSPYNTYLNPGLPPGPIANPGLAAIEAVANAPQTDYLFYVSDKSGKLHFATSEEGHNSNITKYINN